MKDSKPLQKKKVLEGEILPPGFKHKRETPLRGSKLYKILLLTKDKKLVAKLDAEANRHEFYKCVII